MADRKDVRKRFFNEVADLFEDEDISESTKLVDDLNATSFHYMFMVTTIGDITGKEPTYAQMKACETVGNACDLAEKCAS